MFQKLLNRKSRRGFTLIELLVVVLILSILMAIALPLYLNAVSNSELKTCRTNMQSIANAVQANYVAKRLTAYPAGTVDATYVTTNAADLQTLPSCPNSGVYSIVTPGTGGAPFNVHCTGKTTQQVDHGDYQAFVDKQ